MRKMLLATMFAGITLVGGTYLSATPVEVAGLDCFDQATAIHEQFEDFCGGEANCSFFCSTNFEHVIRMSCSCA